MIDSSQNYIDRLLEYITYLSSTFRNRHSQHTDEVEQVCHFVDKYCDLIRRRIQGIRYEDLEIELTGQVAAYLGVISKKYTTEFSSSLWRSFLLWVRDLINLGPNEYRSIELFNELFKTVLSIEDSVNPFAIFDEGVFENALTLYLNLEIEHTNPRYNQSNFDSILSQYEDILPIYLVHEITYDPLLRDYVRYSDLAYSGTTLGVFDKKTFDFMRTGNESYIFLDLNNDGFADGATTINVIFNSHFKTDSIWIKGVGWTILNEKASCDGSQTSFSDLKQSNVLDFTHEFLVQFRILDYVSGTITPYLGQEAGTLRNSDGFYEEVFRASIDLDFYLRASDDFVGSVSDVIVHQMPNKDDYEFIPRERREPNSSESQHLLSYSVEKLGGSGVSYPGTNVDVSKILDLDAYYYLLGFYLVESTYYNPHTSSDLAISSGAFVLGTVVGPFTIVAGVSDKLKVDIDNIGPVTITLDPGVDRLALEVASDIRDKINIAYGVDYVDCQPSIDNKIVLLTLERGSIREIDIQSVVNNCYSILGISIGVFVGDDDGLNLSHIESGLKIHGNIHHNLSLQGFIDGIGSWSIGDTFVVS